ncbi:hypothetical protein TRICI_000148 [Trichomonascus ciferrii]|uniref:Uncharacterized protein n=1 Tax=Trichomonascus ciferrii TaxID=44093 RepID=A0A642VE91_9ASCO|nr:hypothetical protein TRICI_000148 [Trichomonascus ciferrii]
MVSQKVLYYEPGSCSLFVRIVLEEGGFEDVGYERVYTDGEEFVLEDGALYRSVNPKGWIPALRVESGEILSEASVIGQYLVSLRPEKFNFPSTGLAKFQAMAMMNYIAADIHKGIMTIKKPFNTDQSREWLRNDMYKRYQYLEDILESQPYLLGEGFSIADAYAYTTTRWFEARGMDISRLPNIVSWQQRIESIPFVRSAIKNEGLSPLYT